MYFRQFSDAHATYKELMKALDVAEVDSKKKMTIQQPNAPRDLATSVITIVTIVEVQQLMKGCVFFHFIGMEN